MQDEEGGYHNPALQTDTVELKVVPGVPIGYSNYNNYHPRPSPGYNSYSHGSTSGYGTPTQSTSSYTQGSHGTHSSTRSKRRHRRVEQKKPDKPHDWLFFSVCTCLLCCIVPGFAAVVASCLSKEAWLKDDAGQAKKYGRYAMILWIIAMICGAIWIIAIVVAVAVGAI